MQSCLAWLMSVRSAWTTGEYMLAATGNDCGAIANATISQATYDPHGKRCLLSVASAQSPGASVKRKSRTLLQWLCHKVRVSNNSEAPTFLAHANPWKCSERWSNRDQIQSRIKRNTVCFRTSRWTPSLIWTPLALHYPYGPIQHLCYEHKKMLISTYATP